MMVARVEVVLRFRWVGPFLNIRELRKHENDEMRFGCWSRGDFGGNLAFFLTNKVY